MVEKCPRWEVKFEMRISLSGAGNFCCESMKMDVCEKNFIGEDASVKENVKWGASVYFLSYMV